MDGNLILKKNPDIVTRVIDDEVVLLPIYKTSDEINCIYTLNKSASRLWKLIDGRRTYKNIKDALLKEFDTTSSEADKEMAGALKDLEEIKAVLSTG